MSKQQSYLMYIHTLYIYVVDYCGHSQPGDCIYGQGVTDHA